MLATLVDKPFDRDGWLFEVKWDGYRAIAEIRGKDVRLYSRNQLDFNAMFAPVVEALRKLGHDAVLDGEVVVLDDKGRSRFQLLQNYRKTGKGTLIYYVFDLLELDGQDLRSLPLKERKEKLARLVGQKGLVRPSEHIETHGTKLFEAAKEQALEGIVAKNAAGPYREGARGTDWLKVKTHKRQEAVIGGFTKPRGTRTHLGALVLGVYRGDDLVYIGQAGGGFDTAGLAEMAARLDALTQKECPFASRPKTNAPATWVKPELVCEVSFQEWTGDGRMRQPIFVGLREDKDPKVIRREEPRPAVKTAKKTGDKPAHSPQASSADDDPAPKLTHLDKVYWPDEGITKGDLIDYYRQVSQFILPYLKDRPQSLHRHPNGIKGSSFFQKDVGRQPPPDWVETTSIRLEREKRSIASIVCQNEATLLYIANLGCIEINPWNARVGHLTKPDYLVIDLDPEDVAFEHVVETAQAVHKLLDEAGAVNCCKTSGKRGLHIYVPLGARYDHEHARQFAELIARMIHDSLPETTSVVRGPAKRQGKVYLDYLQNSRGQTLAAPYSVRPNPGATVSTPLKWAEVTRRLDPFRFTIHTMPARLEKLGDLWEPVLGPGIDLTACMDKLESQTSAKTRRKE